VNKISLKATVDSRCPHSPRILCIVQHPFLKQIICKFLSDCSLEVEATINNDEALEIATEDGEEFDLVIIDDEILGGGINLAKSLRDADYGGKITLLSAETGLEEVQARRRFSVDWIGKPISLTELLEDVIAVAT